MSEILRVERVEVARWGRASGFHLDLPADHFVVLHGPNESGKTSLATALAWLVAGPGKQGVLQRFGARSESLQASLSAMLGSDRLDLEAKATVTGQSSGTAAKEQHFRATMAGVSLDREHFTARLGGGDFDSYRRIYWVTALEVADGSNLQESVSVQAVFGGVNPYTKERSLKEEAQRLLGAARGKAAGGSAREMHDRDEDGRRKLSALADGKLQWARIEADLMAEKRNMAQSEERLDGLESQLGSVELAIDALSRGLVASRARAASDLEEIPEPSAQDRRLHERMTSVRAKIGELAAAHKSVSEAWHDYEAAWSEANGDWRPLVGATALGEAGVDAAADAESRLRLMLEQWSRCEQELEAGRSSHRRYEVLAAELSDEWNRRYPSDRSPGQVLEANEARSERALGAGTPTGAADSGGSGRRLGIVGSLLGTACSGAVAVLAVVQGDWTVATVAGVGTLALVVASHRVLRAAAAPDEPPDPDQVDRATRLQGAIVGRDAAHTKLAESQEALGEQHRRAEAARQDYRQRLAALGVPEQLAAKFEPHAVSHLKAVRKAQSCFNRHTRAQKDEAGILAEVRSLLAHGPTDETGEPPGDTSTTPGAASLHTAGPRHDDDTSTIPGAASLHTAGPRHDDDTSTIPGAASLHTAGPRHDDDTSTTPGAASLHTAGPRHDDDTSTTPGAASLHTAGPRHDDDTSTTPGAASLPEFRGSAEAEALLSEACDRVDRYSAAKKAARDADDALKQAVRYDESAMAFVEDRGPEDLRALQRDLKEKQSGAGRELDEAKDRITALRVDRKRLESPDDTSAELVLERGALSVQIEDAVVRGLGHHLAARLLKDAAERHRKTQQPKLLQRTKELVCDVADWTNLTVNPQAPATVRAADRTDNLLVDGPRGEHSAQTLSLGAQTLLYLALRLATVEEQSEARGVRLPLLLDDVLVALDDERAEGCLGVLSRFSQRHQLILLTCHHRTVERAEDAGAVVLSIPPPAPRNPGSR